MRRRTVTRTRSKRIGGGYDVKRTETTVVDPEVVRVIIDGGESVASMVDSAVWAAVALLAVVWFFFFFFFFFFSHFFFFRMGVAHTIN
jgi:hypothetical protein